MGKGREIAACAYEHFATGGRRVLWLSVSQDLRLDAARDVDDVREGAAALPQLALFPDRQTPASWMVPQGDLDAKGVKDGVLFMASRGAGAGAARGWVGGRLSWAEPPPLHPPPRAQTYSLLINKGKGLSRLDQAVQWLSKHGDDKARGRGKGKDCVCAVAALVFPQSPFPPPYPMHTRR